MNCPVLPIRGWRLSATLSSYPVERFLCCYRNESGEPKLVLDAAPYEKTKRIYEGLQRMGERLADQMEEADAEEREGEEDWER